VAANEHAGGGEIGDRPWHVVGAGARLDCLVRLTGVPSLTVASPSAEPAGNAANASPAISHARRAHPSATAKRKPTHPSQNHPVTPCLVSAPGLPQRHHDPTSRTPAKPNNLTRQPRSRTDRLATILALPAANRSARGGSLVLVARSERLVGTPEIVAFRMPRCLPAYRGFG